MKTLQDFRAGDTFSLERECDRYRPVYYAAVSGDFNPLHIDPEVARGVGLPGTILHGMCTYAWLSEACVAYLEDPARLVRLWARFARPVSAGDRVRFEGRCVAVEGQRLRLQIAVVNQRGEDVLKGAVAEAVVEEAP
jgi:acyl dehydratase